MLHIQFASILHRFASHISFLSHIAQSVLSHLHKLLQQHRCCYPFVSLADGYLIIHNPVGVEVSDGSVSDVRPFRMPCCRVRVLLLRRSAPSGGQHANGTQSMGLPVWPQLRVPSSSSLSRTAAQPAGCTIASRMRLRPRANGEGEPHSRNSGPQFRQCVRTFLHSRTFENGERGILCHPASIASKATEDGARESVASCYPQGLSFPMFANRGFANRRFCVRGGDYSPLLFVLECGEVFFCSTVFAKWRMLFAKKKQIQGKC